VPPKLDLDTSNLIPFELPRRGAALLDPGEQGGEQSLLLFDSRTDVLGQGKAQRLLTLLNGIAEQRLVTFEPGQVGQQAMAVLSPPGTTQRACAGSETTR
jgi:hypothetical protein